MRSLTVQPDQHVLEGGRERGGREGGQEGERGEGERGGQGGG